MLREGWAHEVIIHLGDGSPLSWTLSPGKAFPVLLIRASVCAACFGTQGRRSEPTVRRVTSFRDSPRLARAVSVAPAPVAVLHVG